MVLPTLNQKESLKVHVAMSLMRTLMVSRKWKTYIFLEEVGGRQPQEKQTNFDI